MSYDVLRRFGLFIVEDFLDHETCVRLREQVRASRNAGAYVLQKDGYVVDESVRKTKRATVEARTEELVATKLLSVMTRIADHFACPLENCDTPQFLIYKQHDFFQPHQDTNAKAPQNVRSRKISAVIFLNNAASPEADGKESNEILQHNTFDGGALTFYGLMDDARCAGIGFPLLGRIGLLVAFRSDTLHEVTPVTSGERYTVVSWYR